MHFLNRVLGHVHKVNEAIQISDLLLSTCANVYTSLQDIVQEIREDFDELEQQAKTTLPNVDYRTVRRIKIKRNR